MSEINLAENAKVSDVFTGDKREVNTGGAFYTEHLTGNIIVNIQLGEAAEELMSEAKVIVMMVLLANSVVIVVVAAMW